MFRKHLLLLSSLIAFFLTGCEKENYPFYNGEGKKPVYIDFAELDNIKNVPFMQIEKTGTIFLLDTLFFLLEKKKGIHVYDISNENFPQYLTFFNIPAITDFTISGNMLYTDSWTDLLTIDMSNLLEIQLINRQKDVFKPILFPQLYAGHFECADLDKGVIIDWVNAELKHARCQIIN